MNIILAALSSEGIVRAIIWLVVFGLIFYLLHWLITYLAIQDPWAKVARAVLAIGAVLILINVLLGLVGKPLFAW
jgi:hypothetical protein